ncbi:MAG: hypothetical protein ACREO4_13040 [Lysobacter sp.]
MTGPEEAARYAALYAPARDDLLRALPDVADGLHAQLIELHKRPSADRCDRLSINLAGAQTAVRKLREALIREGSGDGQ